MSSSYTCSVYDNSTSGGGPIMQRPEE